MIRGIVFDKDGTLFDFNATWRGTVERALDELTGADRGLAARMAQAVGYDFDTRRFVAGSAAVAGSGEEVARIWSGFLPGAGVAALERRLNAIAAEASGEDLTPAAADLPGLLDGLRARGIALGVATHDSEAGARAHLTAAGAIDRFAFIAGYDSGLGLKPGPGMIHAFCEGQDLDAAVVAMIGDSVHDLQAGRAAGAGLVVGVLTGPAQPEELSPHCDAVLASIEDLPRLLDARAA